MQRLSTSGAAMPRGVRELLVIAILAIIAFRGKVQELWTAIVNGMNAL